ncbi:Heparan sulfate glucosamine 3-O-sulfotransferase 1 [Holothuria leucospilota]|uniref:Heparan sulfate glucosamine 3-O-sulfotransferase 1 n=1 Tax=Holothuria leucospilota TaxID=206669 RepID=A0A9Q1C4V6_HOLLE|nr:Heparan sulfate glucosamine 3-O-sulfotransferase 1 [Holothuria leucospilota]
MKSVRVVFSFLVLTTIIFCMWSWTHRQSESPTNHFPNNTLIGKLASAEIATASVGNAGIINNPDRYIHGCYSKGPIGTVQLLLDQNKLKTLGCTRRSPQVVIFGVRKGGTTTLRDFLSFHPQLSVTDTEIHYLEFLSRKSDARHPYATKFLYGERGNSVRVIGGEAYSNIFQPMERLKTYASLMPYSTPRQLVVEKTPKYFVCKNCPILLHRMIPDCKLIAILVDPVKRAISDYLDILRGYDHIEKIIFVVLG